MGVLGKDLFDIYRPRTHLKIQFGTFGYWVENKTTPLPYGTVLTELLNYDTETSHPQQGNVLEIYLTAGEDIFPIQSKCSIMHRLENAGKTRENTPKT